MKNTLFHFDRKQGTTLQTGIRQMIIDALLDGMICKGEVLPSCRSLADKLQVSRNTIAQAYQALCEDGIMESHPRRGFFIAEDLSKNPLWADITAPQRNSTDETPQWIMEFMNHRPSQLRHIEKPQNWHEYKYPFLFGQVDSNLFPITAWRECSRQAMAVKNLELWTGDALNDDDPQLIDYIKTRLLPHRGIGVADDNILITMGAQNALYMLASMFASNRIVGVEDPGYPDARYQFSSFSDNVVALPVDSDGLIMGQALQNCDIIYTTPSYQYPTNATMSLDRRRELLKIAKENQILIIEDDYECESDFNNKPKPSCKALDDNGNVIYIGSLSKNLFPALRLGYVVASADIINELRYQRRLILRHAPMNNQRIAALFLRLGYHQSFYNRLQKTLAKRKAILQDAIDKHLQPFISHSQFGMSGAWLKLKAGDSAKLAELALQEEIIIESGDVFFANPMSDCPYIRLGFSSIEDERITEGIKLLAELCGELQVPS